MISPPGMAVGLLFAFVCVYVAYTYYVGRNTVPVPTYITGFADFPAPPGSHDKKKGMGQQVAEANEFFADGDVKHQTRGNAPKGSINQHVGAMNLKDAGEPSQGFDVRLDPEVKVKPTSVEGFGGVAIGAGSPDCIRSSSEGAALVGMFANGASPSENLRELTEIVGKLSCFKKDLVSPAFVVDATRTQPFATLHDLEPISETTSRCFAKTISPRDLEIAFDKWSTRGELLLRRLVSEYRLLSADADKAQGLFRALMRDVLDIARGSCLAGEPMIAGKPGPRDPHPFENPDEDYGEYTGYY